MPHFLWSRTALESARSRSADSDPSLQPALHRLRNEMTEALAFEPVSVMSKELVPPSGDKHDYMSQGPYWWPDPDKPDGLPYIGRDGVVNPEIETLDSRKQQNMIAAVEALALGSYVFEDRSAAEHAALLIRTWFIDPDTKMNPHLEYGQRVPGRCDGRCYGIIDTLCYCSLIESVELLEDAGVLTDMDRSDLMMWMKAYRDWLVSSDIGRAEAHQGNNHGTWYDAQLCALAYYTGDPRIVFKVVEEAKEHRIATQIEPDGSQPRELERTRSETYTSMNTLAFLNLARYAETVEVDLWYYETDDGRGIRKAIDFYKPYVVDGERWTWQQLDEFDRASLAQLFKRASVGLDDATYLEWIELLPEAAASDRVHLCFG